LAYSIDKDSETVLCYPNDRFLRFDKIEFFGFAKLPKEMNVKGGFKTKTAQAAIRRLGKTLEIERMIVSNESDSSVAEIGNVQTLTFNYTDFKDFIAVMKRAKSLNDAELRRVGDSFFLRFCEFDSKEENVTARGRLSKLLTSLDRGIISEMSGDEISQIIDFTSAVVSERYIKTDHKRKLTLATKLKFDLVAMDQVIQGYEERFSKEVSESDWGKFLKKNLYMVESRYVHIFDRLNVISARSREVDFALIDTHGFLDIFEIKTPKTKLLASSQDRGNYYWNAEATKAITQAEKYLYNAEQKGLALTKDINRELGIDVHIVRPRALLVMGHSRQFTEKNQIEDFRVLRMSLKNVEIILYDELLVRLKNQRDKSILE